MSFNLRPMANGSVPEIRSACLEAEYLRGLMMAPAITGPFVGITAWERFWGSVRFQPGSCWIWVGLLNNSGYGSLRIAGVQFAAHRVAYTLAHGSLSEEMVIDHLCRERACVNATHMEAVSDEENRARGVGWTSEAILNTKNGLCAKGLHDRSVMTRTSSGFVSCVQCRREYVRRTKPWRRAKKRKWKPKVKA